MTKYDLARLDAQEIDIVQQWRTHHHAIAQLFAFGMTEAMISRRTGVSRRRLTLYLADPSFQELVTHYAGRRNQDFGENRDPYRELSYQNMMAGEMTVQEHFERAADNGELIPVAIANRISQERADRLGYSKHSVVHHEHDFASALDRAIARSSTVIEGQALSPPHPEPAPAETASPTQPPDSPRAEPSQPLSLASVQRRELIRRRFG